MIAKYNTVVPVKNYVAKIPLFQKHFVQVNPHKDFLFKVSTGKSES